MSARLERHARGKGWWDQNPSRSAELGAAVAADPDPSRTAPAVKDTRRWCRGKPGRVHKPEIVRTHLGWQPAVCKWAGRHDFRLLRQGRDEDGTTVGWVCYHEERCSACGKVLRSSWELRRVECPVFPGSAEQKAEAEREAAEYPERWRSQRRPRRVITGPQGYRRKRAS